MDAILSYQRKEEDDFYFILGCDETSSMEQILAEYKVRVMQCHPDKHRDDQSAHERFARLQQAKETLCDPERRKDYDTWKNCGMAITYDDWKAKRNAIHTSMHWAMKTKKEPMLEDVPTATSSERSQTPGSSTNNWRSRTVDNEWGTSQWSSWTPSDNIRKFRNYEI